jgi:heme oxygenase
VAPFRAATDALGWTYVLERNAILHGVLRRYLERVHAPLAKAGAYLAGNERATGSRMRELGRVLDTVAQTEQIADRIVDAANTAFRCQHHWFGKVVPLYGRVA